MATQAKQRMSIPSLWNTSNMRPIWTAEHDMGSRRYPGVRSFSDVQGDRKLFRGRDHEKQVLLHRVLAERLVVLFGRSGYGKSSLLNAGLLQPLRDEGYCPLTVRLNDPHGGPFVTLFEGIEESAARGGVEFVRGDDASLWHFFKTMELWQGTQLLSPVIIFDQFEELFTLQQPEPRRQFISELADLVRGTRPKETRQPPAEAELSDRPPEVKVVLSLREDLLAHLEDLSGRLPGILNARFRLGPLVREEARKAIVDPAAIEDEDLNTPPFTWSQEALERVLDFLCQRRTQTGVESGEEVEPFQLQLICQYVEDLVIEKTKDGASHVTVQTEDLGSDEALPAILTAFYEESVKKVAIGAGSTTAAGPTRFRHRLGRYNLVSRLWKLCEYGFISASGRRLSLEESDIGRRFGIMAEPLRDLVDLRLLRQDARVGSRYYELSHDTLVDPILRSRQRRQRRNRRRASLGGGLIAASLLVMLSMYFLNAGARRDRRLVERARVQLYQQDDPTLAVLLLRQVENHTDVPEWASLVADAVSRPVAHAVLAGHDGAIRTASFDSDGGNLLTVSEDGTARLWSTGDPDSVRVFAGHTQILRGAAVDPTFRWLATASADNTARVWRVGDPTAYKELHHGGTVRAVAFSPGGELLATASDDGTARLWRIASDEFWSDGTNPDDFFTNLPHVSAVSAASFSPSGELVLTASEDGKAFLWDVRDGRKRDSLFVEGEGRMRIATFSPGGSRILTVSRDGVARMWTNAGRAWRSRPMGLDTAEHREHRSEVRVASFNTTGEFVATGSEDGFVRVWNVGTGIPQIVQSLTHPADGVPVNVSFHPTFGSPPGDADSEHADFFLLTAWSDGTVRLWKTSAASDSRPYVELAQPTLSAAMFSPDGELVVTASRDGSARLWRLDHLGHSEMEQPAGSGAKAQLNTLSHDGLITAVVRADTVDLTGQATGKTASAVFTGQVQSVSFSDTDAFVLIRTEERGGGSQAWVWPTDASRDPVAVGGGQVVSAGLSPTGDTVLVISPQDGTPRAELFRSNGERLATSSDEMGSVRQASFSPDGRHVLLLSYYGNRRALTVWLWDLENGSGRILGKRETANHATFSSRGDRVVAGFWGGAWIYDLNRGDSTALHVPEGQVEYVSFSEKGDKMLTATDHSVRVWLPDRQNKYSDRYPLALSLVSHIAGEISEATFSADGETVLIRADQMWEWFTSPDSLVGHLEDAPVNECEDEECSRFTKSNTGTRGGSVPR